MRIPWAESDKSTTAALRPRDGNSTVSSLIAQWANPTDVSTILMVIGGDVVQKALAQGTGKPYTPVCFSFGCVAYTFTALVSIMGDGKLLPRPDYPVKVFNLKTGYSRENRNWVLGRILRDLETQIAKAAKPHDGPYGIQISVWEALDNPNGPTQFSWGRLHWVSAAMTLLQFAIAAVPALPSAGGDWSVLFITAVGTLLIQAVGVLPQWVAEKLPNRQRAVHTYALTSGNGSRDIAVVMGRGKCLDLDEMANAESPRKGWVWHKFRRQNILSREAAVVTPPHLPAAAQRQLSSSQRVDSDPLGNGQRQSRFAGGLPFGFWLTRIVVVVTSVLSLLFLVNLAVPKDYGWFILAIGGIGMFQNGVLAGTELATAARNLPLRLREVLRARKVMDGIMEFDTAYPGLGRALLAEFFPGPLYDAEERWWNGDFEAYDRARLEDEATRGRPRRLRPTLVERVGSHDERGEPPPEDEKKAASATLTAIEV